jgi:hypothetical protein
MATTENDINCDFISTLCSELTYDKFSGVPELILEANFQQASTELEKKLSEEASALDARLWWVECQIELQNVPATALCSPLEDVVKNLDDDRYHSIAPLAVRVFLRVAKLLLEKKQVRLGYSLLEKAFEISVKYQIFKADNFKLLQSNLLHVLNKEIERANLRREQKSYLNSLENRLIEINKTIAPPENSDNNPPPTSEKPPQISSKSIMEEAYAETKRLEAEIISEPLSKEKIIHPSFKVNTLKFREGSTFPSWLTILLLIIIISSGSYMIYNLMETNRSDELLENQLAIGLPLIVPDNISLDPPTVILDPRSISLAKNSKLEDVSKRLENLKNIPQPTSAPPTTNPEQPTAPSPSLPLVSQPPLAPNKAREKLPTWDRIKTPEMKDDDLANTVIESLGSPQENGREPDLRGATGLDGKPIKPEEVIQYSNVQFYKTITKTNVLSAPSVMGKILSQLDLGAKIQVTSQMGQWLEIRSAAGKKGYIYLQDAEKVN